MSNAHYPKAYDALADSFKEWAMDSNAVKKPAWPMKEETQVVEVVPGLMLARKISAPQLRIQQPGSTTYLEIGFNEDGVFTASGTAKVEDMDALAQHFIGAVIARMNRVVR